MDNNYIPAGLNTRDIQCTDIGINLTDKSFSKDRAEVIEQGIAAGVTRMMVTGTSLKESVKAISLCQQYPEHLYCTAGIHPHYAGKHTKADIKELLSLTQESCVVACGEMGLDFNRNFSTPTEQITAFELQLENAHQCQLPLFLHERDAHKKMLDILKHYRDDVSGGVIHCFTGSKEALFNYLDLDLYVGITGWICDERRGQVLQSLVPHIPNNRLLIETDGPYLLPRDLTPKPKSRRNEPKYLPHIANKIAQLRQQPLEDLLQQTHKNTATLFAF